MKTIYLSALLSCLLLVGCNDSDTEVCRYYVQQDLDSGAYSAAIDRLQDSSCQATYPENEYQVDLGAAYLGKAGLTLPKIMSAIIDDAGTTDSAQFSLFVKKMTTLASDTALSDLSHSRDAFKSYLGGVDCQTIDGADSTENGICLLSSFVDILKTTIAIDSMTGGNVSGWIENSKNNADTPALLRSTCALQYAYYDKTSSAFDADTVCGAGFTVVDSSAISFSDSTKQYASLAVTSPSDSKTEYFLELLDNKSIIFTKDYCKTDYSACDVNSDADCYACPINKAEVDLDVEDFLVTALNSSFANINTLISNAGLDNSDELQQSIDEFKTEIKSSTTDTFTLDDIINYLNNK